MLKKRNAQGISIRVIIIAVIALIVLVVLIAVFTGRFGSFGEGLDVAGGRAGKTCKEINNDAELKSQEECDGRGVVSKETLERYQDDLVCCIPPSA